MKNIILIGFITVTLLSCKTEIETIITEVPALRASSIYNDDSVYTYMQSYGGKHAELAASYLQRAEKEELQNEDKALYALKRAITLHPTLDNYKKLGKLLSKTAHYKEMNDLYSFLVRKGYINSQPKNAPKPPEYLFGPPDEDIVFENIVSEILAYNRLDSYWIYEAREIGMNIPNMKNKLIHDERVKMDTTGSDWKNIMIRFLDEDEMTEFMVSQNVFRNLKRSVLDSSENFEISETSVQDFNYDDFNGQNMDFMDDYNFTDFYSNFLLEKKENPNNWVKYNFKHKLYLNNDITALLYAVDTSETSCPKEMRHIYYMLVTYNSVGEIIDSRQVALQSAEKLSTLKFVKNKGTINEFKRNWKKPYDKKDFDNYVTGKEFLTESSFEITPEGKIQNSEITTSN